jgi:hypothetical protein
MLIDSNISTKLNSERTEALFYAKEGMEAVRSIRNDDWDAFVDGTYGLSTSSSKWVLSDDDSDLIDDKFTRTVTIATRDDENKDVSVNVAWNLTPTRIASTTLSTIFSNWISVMNLSGEPGLIAYYTMDDTNGTTIVDSLGGDDGTGSYTATAGKIDGGLSFNGSSNVINLGNNFNFERTDSFSVSFWATKPIDTLHMTVIGKKDVAASKGWDIFIDNWTNIYFWMRDQNANGISVNTATYPFGVAGWHYVVATYDGSSSESGMKIYVDGVDRTSAPSGTLDSSIVNSADTKIGYTNSSYFNGALDDMRIYDRVLTPEEISAVYESQ